jgi:hypothetical protein
VTPEEAACQTLLGEKLGSIRSIRYLSDPEQSAATTVIGALEIETKTGRYVHVAPASGELCTIGAGPALAPGEMIDEGQGAVIRCWTDLTPQVPFAFDGRPVVARAEPVHNDGRICGCAIEFSNGARFEYAMGKGAPRLLLGEAAH